MTPERSISNHIELMGIEAKRRKDWISSKYKMIFFADRHLNNSFSPFSSHPSSLIFFSHCFNEAIQGRPSTRRKKTGWELYFLGAEEKSFFSFFFLSSEARKMSRWEIWQMTFLLSNFVVGTSFPFLSFLNDVFSTFSIFFVRWGQGENMSFCTHTRNGKKERKHFVAFSLKKEKMILRF